MLRVSVVSLCVLVCATGLRAAKDPEFNVDFACGWDGYYRPMEWTPVELGISSELKEPFAGSISVSAQQDGLNTLDVAQTFVLMPDVSLPISLVAKFAFGAGACDLTIRDDHGRVRYRSSRTLWDYSSQNRLLRTVHEQDLLVGLVGSPQFGLMRLAKETACLSARGQGHVYVGPKLARDVPWDWTGFMGLDVLVLCDPDWSQFKPQQVQAICEWASNGGAVLLVLGRHPLPQNSPLRAAIPFQIGEPLQVEIPSLAMDAWGLDSSRSQTVTAWPLSARPGTPMPARIQPETGSLHGTGRLGFGRVAMLAFDPAQLTDAQAERSAAFWTNQIAACIGDAAGSSDATDAVSVAGRGRRIILTGSPSESDPPAGSNPYDNRHRIGVGQTAANQVMDYLFELRQMQPLSIWWVILTLTSLAVLLGPVDYWVLKRLDRQPFTWLTSAAWIAVFTVGAYYGVQYLRAGSMELRAVTVTDGIAGGDCAWSTCYAGIFAPRSDDYVLDNLAPNQWWSGISPMQTEIWAHQREAGVRQILCRQADGGNLPVSLPISIWTVQSLLCEWVPKDMPLTATVERSDGRVVVEIQNLSDNPIRKGYVLFADSYADLGPVGARGTKRFETSSRPFQLWATQSPTPDADPSGLRPSNRPIGAELPRMPMSLTGITDNAFFAQGCLDRTWGMYSGLDAGAAMVCVAFENAPPPFVIRDRSYTVNHIQFARLLVPVEHEEKP